MGVDRLLRLAERTAGDSRALLEVLRREATAILAEDRVMCEAIGRHGVAIHLPAGGQQQEGEKGKGGAHGGAPYHRPGCRELT